MQTSEPTTIQVTGVGSMPGTNSDEAAAIVAGEFDIPHLAELPARGPGADMLGRTLGLVSQVTGEFAAQTTPSGWRLVGGRTGGEPGRAMRRAAGWLAEDGDRLEEHLLGFDGLVKVQVVGPWSLAAGLESVRGTRLLADSGACTDLATALAESVAEHVARMRRRIPNAQVVVQVDEPTLPLVLAGRLRTPSGRGAVRIPQAPEVISGLERVSTAATAAGVARVVSHCCCARQVPFDLLARSGYGAVSIDLAAVGTTADESLGQWWDRGGSVVLGIASAVDPDPAAARAMPESLARTVADLWGRIGFGMADVGERTWLSPACGLAGASPAWSVQVGGLLRAAGRLLESSE